MTITINKEIYSIEIEIKYGKAAQAYAERVLGLKLISCFSGNLIAQ